MKKQFKRAEIGTGFGFHDLRLEESVENSKRRHMLLLMDGDDKFFDHILSVKKPAEVSFVSKSADRGR